MLWQKSLLLQLIEVMEPGKTEYEIEPSVKRQIDIQKSLQ